MAPSSRSTITPGTEIALPGANQTAESSSHGTLGVTQESEDFIEALRRDIEARKARNELLAEAAVEYCQEFGDDLSKYPEHVTNYVRT
jgi:hypothetical protein